MEIGIKLGMTGNRDGISDEAQNTFLEFFKNNKINEVHHGKK